MSIQSKILMVITAMAAVVSGRAASSVDEISRSVVFLLKSDTGSCGSGLLVIARKPYLVTATHVATNFSFVPGESMWVWSEGNVAREIPLSRLGATNASAWTHDSEVDTSILPLDHRSLEAGRMLYVPLAMLDAGTNMPSRDIPITILGFPFGAGVGNYPGEEFSPISRSTKAASGLWAASRLSPSDSFMQNGQVFLVEDAIAQGFSGGPIVNLGQPYSSHGTLILGGGPVTCVGIAASTVADQTGGKFGVVVPIKYAVALINRCDAQP